MNESDILTPEVIIKKVASEEGLTIEEIKSNLRKQSYVTVRHKAMFLIKKFTKLSYSEVGELFNGKDHATVIHACKSVRNQMDVYPNYRKKLNEIISYFTRWPDDEFERYEHYNTDLV